MTIEKLKARRLQRLEAWRSARSKATLEEDRESRIQRIRERLKNRMERISKATTQSQDTPYVVLQESYAFLQEKYSSALSMLQDMEAEIKSYKVANSRLALRLEQTKKVVKSLLEAFQDEIGTYAKSELGRKGIVVRVNKDHSKEEKSLMSELEEQLNRIASLYESKVRKARKLEQRARLKQRLVEGKQPVTDKQVEATTPKSASNISELDPLIAIHSQVHQK